MAHQRDRLVVMGVDGVCFPELLDDETTPIGVYVDLAGDPATVATHECVLKKGSASVALATAAASGNVTASVTAANLITLGATIGDEITAFWEGTVVDGATTHLWRYPMVLKVEDRLFLWPVLISSLKAELPDIAKACSYPGSQTSWWPQISEALRDVRDMIDQGPSGVKAYAIATPAAVRQLGKWAVWRPSLGSCTGRRGTERRAWRIWRGTSTIALRRCGPGWSSQSRPTTPAGRPKGPPLKQAFRPCTCTARAQATAAGDPLMARTPHKIDALQAVLYAALVGSTLTMGTMEISPSAPPTTRRTPSPGLLAVLMAA